MSGNSPQDAQPRDARVRRTRDRLGDAFVELVRERGFDAFTVQDVLERSGVGRSTFYAHFRDKDDLFFSDADEFFEHMSLLLSRKPDAGERVAPVAEMLTHVVGMRDFHDALADAGRLHELLDLGRAHFARGIGTRLAVLPRAAHLTPRLRDELSTAFAGACFALLQGALRSGEACDPTATDALFHRLVWGSVDALRVRDR
ncbi:MAG: TetR/AcrR family transcriptional regulator [Planctomycetes bacterium]|nr:TetR/AcrR family transcriptional regulator [Planctomycetota bacterium]